MQIGFIGLGSMGTGMALNLVKAGHDVRAWNRSKLDPDMVPGVTLVESAAEAFQAHTVFTMLSDDIRDSPSRVSWRRSTKRPASDTCPHRCSVARMSPRAGS